MKFMQSLANAYYPAEMAAVDEPVSVKITKAERSRFNLVMTVFLALVVLFTVFMLTIGSDKGHTLPSECGKGFFSGEAMSGPEWLEKCQ